MKTDWITDTLTELLLPPRRRVSPSLPATLPREDLPTGSRQLPRPVLTPFLAGAFILAASSANAGDPLPAYMERPVMRPAVDCSIAPHWRRECNGERRQSDRGPVAMTRTIQTPAAPGRHDGSPTPRGGGEPQDRPTCNSCPDVTSAKQREYISRWKDRPLAERQAIRESRKGKPDKGGRDRARDRREARDECIADRDSARN